MIIIIELVWTIYCGITEHNGSKRTFLCSASDRGTCYIYYIEQSETHLIFWNAKSFETSRLRWNEATLICSHVLPSLWCEITLIFSFYTECPMAIASFRYPTGSFTRLYEYIIHKQSRIHIILKYSVRKLECNKTALGQPDST